MKWETPKAPRALSVSSLVDQISHWSWWSGQHCSVLQQQNPVFKFGDVIWGLFCVDIAWALHASVGSLTVQRH